MSIQYYVKKPDQYKVVTWSGKIEDVRDFVKELTYRSEPVKIEVDGSDWFAVDLPYDPPISLSSNFVRPCEYSIVVAPDLSVRLIGPSFFHEMERVL